MAEVATVAKPATTAMPKHRKKPGYKSDAKVLLEIGPEAVVKIVDWADRVAPIIDDLRRFQLEFVDKHKKKFNRVICSQITWEHICNNAAAGNRKDFNMYSGQGNSYRVVDEVQQHDGRLSHICRVLNALGDLLWIVPASPDGGDLTERIEVDVDGVRFYRQLPVLPTGHLVLTTNDGYEKICELRLGNDYL